MNLRKKLSVALFLLTAGVAGVVSATSDACLACDDVLWQCGGWQNDHCVLKYQRCLLRNGCELPF